MKNGIEIKYFPLRHDHSSSLHFLIYEGRKSTRTNRNIDEAEYRDNVSNPIRFFFKKESYQMYSLISSFFMLRTSRRRNTNEYEY